MKRYKIAVFSGAYPDTTFLTHLSRKLADDNAFEIQIFGKRTKREKQDGKINFHNHPKNKFLSLLFIIKYFILVAFSDFKKLKMFVKQLKNEGLWWSRLTIILPMLYHKPHVIHIQWIKSYNIFSGFEKILEAKFIVSIRGHQLSISGFLYDDTKDIIVEATNNAVRIHSISDDLTNQLVSLNPECKSKIVKIPPAIDVALFSTKEKVTKNETIQIISVCRLSWKKGLHYGLYSLKILKDRGVAFHYHIVGEGNQKEELQYLMTSLGLEEKVTFHGKLNQFEVKKKLEYCDVFLLPSVQEGFSNAVIEAQAIGLPCVVSNAEGLSENIEEGVTGFIFQKRNYIQAADILQKVSNWDDTVYNTFSKRAKKRAKQHFDSNWQIEEFKNMYRESIKL